MTQHAKQQCSQTILCSYALAQRFNTNLPHYLFFLFPSPPPDPLLGPNAATSGGESSFFADPARNAAMSNPVVAPGCPVAAPIIPFIGLLFCRSSHSARISGSTSIASAPQSSQGVYGTSNAGNSLLSTRYGSPRKMSMLTPPSRIIGFLRIAKALTTPSLAHVP